MSIFNEKVVIITGATKGIGLELATKLSNKGAKLSLCGRNTSVISDLFDDDIFIKNCDVSKHEQIKEFIDDTKTKFGKIDIIINNSALGVFNKIEEITITDWTNVINTNLNGIFYMCHEVIPIIKNNINMPKGYILNVGSISHNYVVNQSSVYSSSKAALKSFSDHLYNELRLENILVSYVASGSVNTNFSKRTPDLTNWKINASDISDIILSVIETGYKYPQCCINYLEVKTNTPIKTETLKE